MAAPVEALRTHCRETAEVFERDDGLFEVGLADPLGHSRRGNLRSR